MLKRIDIVAFTRKGVQRALEIKRGLAADCPNIGVSSTSRFAGPEVDAFESLRGWTERSFSEADALIFVSATGIAVRSIAPHLKDKLTDPAVVCIDEAGQFAISLVSGHVGGANSLARQIADICGGQAVVSTATDVNGRFAIDEWAVSNNLEITRRDLAKRISACLLDGDSVGFISDFPVCGTMPEGLSMEGGLALGACISWCQSMLPFPETLHLVPRTIAVGLGCRRGTDPEKLRAFAMQALDACNITPKAIATVASIDLKADEQAILEFAEGIDCKPRFYSAEQLAATPGQFDESEFVKKTTGVGNVCERSAMQAAIDARSSFADKKWREAPLATILPKTADDGMTISIVGIIPPLSFDQGKRK